MRRAGGTLAVKSSSSLTTGFRVPHDQRPSIWEGAQATLITANLVWTTFCLGGFRPGTMLVTLALTGLLLVVHFGVCAAEKRPWRSTDPAGWCFLPFLAYALINVMAVTPVPWLGWMDWLGWANMIAVFWVTLNGIRSVPGRRILFLALVLLGVVNVLLASYQRFVDADWLMLGRQQVEQFLGRASGSFGIPNSLAGFLILLLPATGALACRRHATAAERVGWGWLTMVFGFGLLLTVSRGGGIALALALLMWPLSTRGWKWQRRAFAALVVLIVLAAGSAALHQASPKMRERFNVMVRDSGELSRPILWRAGWGIFREHPIAGSGAGSYNVSFERHRPGRFVDTPLWAHNEYLNTLSDYGALGFFLLFGACVVVVTRGRRFDSASVKASIKELESHQVRKGLGIGVLAFALQTFVDFHFKTPALAMAFSVVCALTFGQRRQPAIARSLSHGGQAQSPDQRRSSQGAARLVWLLAAAGAAIVMLPVLRFYRAEALRYEARQAIDQADMTRTAELLPLLERGENELRRATALAPHHAGAWADLAYALELRAFADPSQVTVVAETAIESARRATALASAVPEFWIRLGVALDMQSRRTEAEKAFLRAVELAPRNSHGWYYYAYHLSFDTNRRDAALRAIATCLSLDPGNGAAEALRVKLNERSSAAPFIP
jgi:O-antigen ligase